MLVLGVGAFFASLAGLAGVLVAGWKVSGLAGLASGTGLLSSLEDWGLASVVALWP